MRPLVPERLDLDAFDGRCYVGLVPFTMHGSGRSGCPRCPSFQLPRDQRADVRPRRGARSGVYCLRWMQRRRLAVWAREPSGSLPYHFAAMNLRRRPKGSSFASDRRWPGPQPAGCRLAYGPVGTAAAATPGRLEHFLVERYLLYTTSVAGGGAGAATMLPIRCKRRNARARGEPAACGGNRAARGSPLLHYAEGVDVLVFALEELPRG